MTIKFQPLLTVSLLCAGLATAVPAISLADVYVIANSSATVGAGDIKDIFLGEKQLSGSTRAGAGGQQCRPGGVPRQGAAA